MHTIELGSKVRDSVSGWTGVATARYEYMNGCERYEVSAADKDGKPDGHVFDVQQLQLDVAGDWQLVMDARQAAMEDEMRSRGMQVPTDPRDPSWRPVVATGGSRDGRPVAR